MLFIVIAAVLLSAIAGFEGAPISDSNSKLIFNLPPLQDGDRIRLKGIIKAASKSLKFIFYPGNSDNSGPDLTSDEFNLDVGKFVVNNQNEHEISLEFLLRTNLVRIMLSKGDIISEMSDFSLEEVKYLGIIGDIDKIIELEYRFKDLKLTKN